MKTMKRLVAIALAVLMLLGSVSAVASAWDANVDDGKTLSITTKIFRLVDGAWTETEKVQQGEEVRARIYLNTDYYTNSGNLLFFYNNDFFTDSFGSGTQTLTVNPYYAERPYGITATFVGSKSSSNVEQFMVGQGKITPEFAAAHEFAYIAYEFYSGATNQKLSDSQWLFEIPLTVKSDAASGTGVGDFFAVKDTTRSPSFTTGRINVPKGPYDGKNATITSMANWSATLDYESQPVTLYTNLVSASFDAGLGEFANKESTFYTEGDAGDALTVETPKLANFKFAGWKVKGADDSTAAEITAYPAASTEYEAVWESTTGTDETLMFITKIYRQDPETGEWVYTDRVKPGEDVKARLFVDTSYFTNAGNIIFFYDSDFFTDNYDYNIKEQLVPNTSATSSAAVNGVSGEFVKLEDTNNTVVKLVSNGYITQDIVDSSEIITAMYQFDPSTSKKISGDEWFVEFDLTVKDTASGEGEFYIIDKTIKNSNEGVFAYINIPLGEEGGAKEDTKSMHLWDVNATVKSYPVTINSSITLQANGGAFDAADVNNYVIEGVIGDAVDYNAMPELTRDGYTFKGWVPADVAEPTEDDIVTLPAEMPYDDEAYKAFWTDDVEITFVLNNNESNINRTETAGAPFEAPADPEFEGHKFIGWTTDPTCAKVTGLPATYPTEDATYYAVFDAMTYNVYYYLLNDETMKFEKITTGHVTYGDVISPVPASYVVPEGYTLVGPYTDISFENEFVTGTTMPAAEVNLYYKLKAGTYDAVFMVDDAEYARIPTVYDTLVEAPEDPSKEGYVFAGWEPFVGMMDEEGKTYVATWVPAEYTVTWIVDGNVQDAFDVAYGQDVEVTADPVKEGYEFLGWSDDENATEAGTVLTTMPANDLTYYAVFKINQYTISFSETGDSTINPITQDYGTEITAPADPEKEGYTFTGWVDEEGNKVEVPATMPAEDQLLKATWEINSYTVTWILDNGDADIVDTYEYNEAITAPADPVKEGYTFKEWSPAVEANMPAMNLTYTAVYTVNSYDAIFDANGGKWADDAVSKTVTAEYGAQIVAPEDPARTGYVFAGWDEEVGTMPVDGITFTAEWDEATNTPYTVKYYTMDTTGNYDLDNPVVDNRTGTTNAAVTAVTNTTEGFYVDPDKSVLEGTIAADGSTVLEVYYARELYTVTFDANEGVLTGNATADYYYGATVAVPTAEREGYEFAGWDKNVSTVAVSNADYVAQWDEKQYTIVFDADGGTAIDSVTADYLSEVNAPAAVTTKEGYTFGGWAETQGETDAAKAVTFPVTMPLNGDTYYAIWTPNKYTITFAETGDTVIAPITQDYNTEIAKPADPVKEGYTFEGWDAIIPDYMPAEDMTITAQWKVNSYDITWDVDGVDTTENVEFGSELVAPADPEKDGYTFTGWEDADGKTPDDYVTVPSKDVEFTAQWDANEYTITFAETGDTVIAPITQDCDTAITAPANPTKTGYEFAGWVDEEGNPAAVPSTMPAGDMTLTATWTANSDTPFKVVINYTDFATGAATTEEFDYTGTTDNAIEIVDAIPGEPAEKTEYVVLGDLAVANYELDAEAANEFTGVVAADGSTVLNLYYVPVKRTANFDANGGAWDDGDTTKAVQVSHGSLVKPAAPADPTREGYTFDGWNGLSDTTKLTQDGRTFTAKWVANEYTITYDIDGATTTDTYEYNALINKPVDPAKEGYSFAGWEPSIPDNMPAENITVTATWTVNSYDVTWNVDGVETTEEVEYGAAIETPADPTKEGYTFAGWKDAEGNDVPATMPATDKEFTAQWAVNPYTVSYYVYEPATGKFAAAGTATVDYGTAIPAAVPSTYVVPTGYTLNATAYTDAALTAALAAGATMPAEKVALYYTLEANTYDAVFNVDGKEYDTVETEFGAQIVAPADPTKDGYTFTGWSPEVGTMDEEGKTFEAQWTEKTYNANFKANGGLFADGETTTVVPTKFGAAIIAPAAPARDGYTFAGWDTVPAAMPANDVTIVAKWTVNEYTITFADTGDTTIEPIKQAYGTAVTAPAAPTKTGYTFAGWDAMPATMPAKDTTVTAKWTKNNYTVTWNVDGVKSTEIYEFGATIVKPADPTKEGHTFKAWTPAVDATMPAYNVEYTATWNVLSYKATFDANGGKYADGTTSKEATFAYGAAVSAPEVPTQTGYSFAGWEPALSTMPAADTTYKAVWTVGEEKAYTVEIYTMDTAGNYGEPVVESKTAAVGEAVKVTPTPTEGFYLDTTKANVLEDVIKADTATVLKVYYARNEYTITFNGNGGTVDGAATTAGTYYHGATVVEPLTEREGYTLKGWSPALSIVAVADATYDAQWEINEYTISFDTDGGSLILPITQDYGTDITAPAAPVKEGYVFDGWVDADGNEASVPATMPAEDIDLTATWVKDKFTVTFYESEEDGAKVLQQTENEYELNIVPPVATLAGYDFAGWVDEDGNAVDFDNTTVITPAHDVNYYATWNVKSYALNYQANGGQFDDGTNRKSYTVPYGTASADMEVPEDPTREGYTFTGWNIDLPATMPATPVNRVAQWQINTYNANFYKEADDDEAFDTIPVVFEEAITAPDEAPSKTGYVFEGWSTDGKTVLDDLGTIGAEDAAFYAVWSEATDTAYKVEHYYMGTDMTYADTATRTDDFTGTTNATATVTPDAADNFTVDTAKSVLEGTIAADGSLVLKVYYEREINTLKVDIDGVVTETEYPYDAPVAPVEEPTKEGYTFDKWVDENGNEVTPPATMPEDDVTIKATWTVNVYNVTYNVDGTVYDGPTATNYGAAITVPTAPAKDGYTFAGWFDADGKQPADYTSMPANDLVFDAKWDANSNVSYILEVYEMKVDGTYPAAATETITYDDGVVGTSKTVVYAVPEGFTLDETASVLTGTIPTTGTLVLKAYLIRNQYNLNVDVDGVVTTTPYYYNQAVAAVADPAKDGYVFAGWVDANGDEAEIPAIMPANDVTVYATWDEDSFTASFNAGEGKFDTTGESVEEIDVTFGEDITAPAETPVREGYTFGGWATPDAPETPVTNYGKMDADGAEFVAIWIKTDFTVTFYDYKPAAGGPNAPTEKYSYASSTYQFGDTIAFPGDPSFEHYVFLGWSETEGDRTNLITSADAITMPAEDYELYAVYERVKIMLIPKNDTCTTIIDRAGGDVDDYTADSQWYVYGLQEYITSTTLLDEYIDVSGDGRIEIIYVNDVVKPYTGTGTVINVYDRLGTEETSDDILVESFHIIIFGDVNGDSVAQAIDATYVFDEAAGLTTWSNPYADNYTHYLVKAADITGEGFIESIDGSYISDHTIGIVIIDQETGRLS
ncbi:MAG: InlB B-repeat-containing protein [Clostridia bacterium]|nr:InlB B-repeat-containing protein [Clostridia bacterium]